MTTSLDKILGEGRPLGCLVCGARNVAQVQVLVKESGPPGLAASRGRTASVSRSFCGDHAAEVYARLSESLKGASDAG
jgi:hypothetical protein